MRLVREMAALTLGAAGALMFAGAVVLLTAAHDLVDEDVPPAS